MKRRSAARCASSFRSIATERLLRLMATKIDRHAIDERRPPDARVIPLLRVFDLVHLGAKLGEDHRGGRRRNAGAELDHDEPGKRKRFCQSRCPRRRKLAQPYYINFRPATARLRVRFARTK